MNNILASLYLALSLCTLTMGAMQPNKNNQETSSNNGWVFDNNPDLYAVKPFYSSDEDNDQEEQSLLIRMPRQL